MREGIEGNIAMSKFHVRREQMERFLRTELSREENREIIRHLLAECPVCRETMRQAARRQGFKVVEVVEDGFDLGGAGAPLVDGRCADGVFGRCHRAAGGEYFARHS